MLKKIVGIILTIASIFMALCAIILHEEVGTMIFFFICAFVFAFFAYLFLSYNKKYSSQSSGNTNISKLNNKFNYEFMHIKVAGVTFNNEDGSSRQSLLRKIKFNDAPFDEKLYIELRNYDFNGEVAIGIYANNKQIGNVPRSQVPYLIENLERVDQPTAIDVYGGGYDKNYGCEITLRLFKNIKNEKTTNNPQLQ